MPTEYQGLYSQLSSQIETFTQSLGVSQGGPSQPVTYAGQLLTASSEYGTALLNNGYMQTVQTEIQEQQALGVKAVTVHINFPALYAPAYSNRFQYQAMLSFYEQVASEVHGLGMQLIVESQVQKSDPSSAGSATLTYAQGLSWSNYQAGRAQNCATIAQYVNPDYMAVITEPDTEASVSGQFQTNTVSGSTQMLQAILAAVQQTGSSVSLGAGTGTWQNSFTSFMNAYAAQPVQFLDVHIYPINNAYFQNAVAAADIAHGAGKQIGMTEGWLGKVGDSELTAGLDWNTIDSRNVYDFWGPLDSQWLQSITAMANAKQFTFISPFWTSYFFAYMPYSGTSPSQAAAIQNAVAAMAQPAFTATGLAWERAILLSADTSAPQVPAGPAFQKGFNVMHLTWGASSDNVGVAGYYIYKDDTLLATSPTAAFDDTTISRGSSSTYSIRAFDAVGNVSPSSIALKASRR